MSVVILFPRILKTRLLFCLVLDVDIINAQPFLFRWCYPSSSMLVPKVIWISNRSDCCVPLVVVIIRCGAFLLLSTYHFPLLWPFISLDLTFPLLGLCLLKQKLRVLLWIVDLVLAGGNWRFNFFLLPPPASYPLSPFEKDTQRFLLANMSFLPPRIWKKKTRAIHFESNAPIWPLEI